MNRKISASEYLASMSNCVTIADDALEQQKEISPEITAEDVVEFVLEEAVWAAVVFSECSRIGDFSTGGEFRQEVDQVSAYSKDLECSKLNGNEIYTGKPGGNPQVKLESGESIHKSISLMRARENLELIFDSLAKREEKIKVMTDCKIVSERMLAHNELRIENGQISSQIHLDGSVAEGNLNLNQLTENKEREEEKEETKTEGPGPDNLDVISLPSSDLSQPSIAVAKPESVGEPNSGNLKDCPSPYTPSSAQDLRQVFSEACRDPNRPRAYAIAEEDVKRMFIEIEEIPFHQMSGNPQESTLERKPNRNEEEYLKTSGFYEPPHESVKSIRASVPSFEGIPTQSASLQLALQREEEAFSGSEYPQDEAGEFSVNQFTDKTNLLVLSQGSSESETTISNTDPAGVADDTDDFSHSSFCGKQSPSEKPVQQIGDSRTINPQETPPEAPDFLKDIHDGTQSSMHKEEWEPEIIDDQQLAPEGNIESHSKHSIPVNGVPGKLDSQRKSTSSPSSPHNASSDSSLTDLEGNEANREIAGEEDYAIAKREPETASSDSRVSPEKRSWNLKESYSAHTTVEGRSEHLKTGLSGPRPSSPIGHQVQLGHPLEEQSQPSSETFLMEKEADLEHSQADAESTTACVASNGEEKLWVLPAQTVVVSQRHEDDLIASETCSEEVHSTEANEGVTQMQEENSKEDVSNFKQETEDLLLEENKMDTKMKLLRPSGPSDSVPSNFVQYTSHSKIEWPGMVSQNNLQEKDLSEDNFIGQVENVIQIIEPADNSNDEDAVSFCLPDELEIEGDGSQEKDAVFTSAIPSDSGRRIRSGMTTIGPMKNISQDPKDLTCDVDFGKITHITSYREANDEDLTATGGAAEDLGAETSTADRREFLQVGSPVNRDIASLTKVQKIREVMSYHPKYEDDFDEDNNLNRLDLKDVESLTDDRYKPQDVSIPLLSFDVREADSHGSKDLVQNLNLVLSGNCFANGNFYLTNEAAEDTAGENEDKKLSEETTTAGSERRLPRDSTKKSDEEDLLVIEANEDASRSNVFLQTVDSDSSHRKKHNTLGSAFRKASTKLTHKDCDFNLRNTKSLPRDAGKLMATESIKSLLEDCHSSAANVLKKSRSFLKNTQTLFRTISQTRFAPTTSDLNRRKLAPSEPEVPNSDTNIHSFFSKEDFTKAKIIIKNKIQKTFKSPDTSSSRNFHSPSTTQVSSKHRNLSLCAKETTHTDQQRLGRPQAKDTQPKTPQPCKTPFAGSKVTFQDGSMQDNDPLCPNDLPKSHSVTHQHLQKGEAESKTREENGVPDYIIMETIEGLPAPDLEGSCYLVEVEISESPDAVSVENAPYATLNSAEKGEAMKNEKARGETNVLQESLINGLPLDQGISLPSRDGEKCQVTESTESDKKGRNRSKKLTARLRNFWSSAFGKTSPTKKESSEQTYK